MGFWRGVCGMWKQKFGMCEIQDYPCNQKGNQKMEVANRDYNRMHGKICL